MTLKAKVIRQNSSNDGTPGRVALEDGFGLDTLELGWANNEKGRSCIIPDTYKATLQSSDHLGSPNHKMITRADGSTFDLYRMIYRLEDKHGRTNCEIHNANFAGEVKVGEETQLHGCTAVGHGYGEIQNHAGAMQFAILNSVRALEELIEHTKGEDLEISYEWAPGCEPAPAEAAA